MAALRPHLRICLVCRARLRDYRAVPARVAAAGPPVTAGFLLASVRKLLDGFVAGRTATAGAAADGSGGDEVAP